VLVVGPAGRRAESLCVLLRALRGVEHIGRAENPTAAWQAITELRPTAVLIDVGLPGAQGLVLLERLVAEWPSIGRIALVATDDQARAARAAGATAILPVPTTLDRLANGIRETHAPCGVAL